MTYHDWIALGLRKARALIAGGRTKCAYGRLATGSPCGPYHPEAI